MTTKLRLFAKSTIVAACLGLCLDAAAADARDDNYRLVDSLPAAWTPGDNFSPTLPSEDSWWRSFNDSLLDSLIAIGEKRNFNVLQAARRMEIARLALRQVCAGYYPSFSFSGGWTKSRTPGAMSGSDVPSSDASHFSAGIDMSWQIDLFGKITARARERKSMYSVSRADYAGTMLSLCSNIATAYITLRMYQAQLDVIDSHISSQAKIVAITEARNEAGIASMLDVSQARTVYYSTVATRPSINSSIHATVNAIAVLLGMEPGTLDSLLVKPRPIPDHRIIISTGIPMDLLRRRPDIVAAERLIDADAAALGIARKDYLPSLTLNGSIATMAHNAGDLFSSRSLSYSIAPTLSWTIFDGLGRRYAVASAREQLQADVDAYNLTVINAVSEVDNAMNAYVNNLLYIDNLTNVVDQASKSFEYSVDLYKRGLSQFYNVVEAQNSLLTYSSSLVTARCNAIISLIDIYKALGGGWSDYLR